jgi:hypothetical protein
MPARKGSQETHMPEFATPSQFKAAPVGHPFMECCFVCGLETGTILMKRVGSASAKADHTIPRKLVPTEETRCEFCQFLGHYFASEKIVPSETGKQYGAAKLVTEDSTGVRELFAFVPFDSGEDREVKLAPDRDGGPVTCTLNHGMIILITKDDSVATLRRVLEHGA